MLEPIYTPFRIKHEARGLEKTPKAVASPFGISKSRCCRCVSCAAAFLTLRRPPRCTRSLAVPLKMRGPQALT